MRMRSRRHRSGQRPSHHRPRSSCLSEVEAANISLTSPSTTFQPLTDQDKLTQSPYTNRISLLSPRPCFYATPSHQSDSRPADSTRRRCNADTAQYRERHSLHGLSRIPFRRCLSTEARGSGILQSLWYRALWVWTSVSTHPIRNTGTPSVPSTSHSPRSLSLTFEPAGPRNARGSPLLQRSRTPSQRSEAVSPGSQGQPRPTEEAERSERACGEGSGEAGAIFGGEGAGVVGEYGACAATGDRSDWRVWWTKVLR